MEAISQQKTAFPVREEYARCLNALKASNVIALLPETQSLGVVGIDGKEYPIPTLGQVEELFACNAELIAAKLSQGFDALALTPIASPVPFLIERVKAVILKHAAEGMVCQTRASAADPLIPLRVNKEKQVWPWETLVQALDTDELIYFPEEYTANHRGHTKLEVLNHGRFCAVPGWSVGLVESYPFLAQPGYGKTLGDRKQLEVGLSPREYLQILKGPEYQGETGRTLEDFITGFITRLETNNEVSHDDDYNALWCLAQYLKIPWAEVVPAGRWIKSVGRLRLDTHRTGNKKCTKIVGAATTVRLLRE